MTWVSVSTGKSVSLTNPMPGSIDIRDIAHALSHLCRFTGHTRRLYTVAQHSVLVARAVPEKDRFHGLMHDAPEAYIGDVSSPLKAMLPEYKRIEQEIWRTIAWRFSISPTLPESVKHADLVMLATERRDLLKRSTEDWPCLAGITPQAEIIYPWGPEQARHEFMNLFFSTCPSLDGGAA